MTKGRAKEILEESGLLGKRGTYFSDFARFPCPFRQWTHDEDSRRRLGSSYYLDLNTLEGGCFSCKDHSTLWQILAFRALTDRNPYLEEFAAEVLALTKEESDVKVHDAFETASA